jgi:regulator of replication initiation timing
LLGEIEQVRAELALRVREASRKGPSKDQLGRELRQAHRDAERRIRAIGSTQLSDLLAAVRGSTRTAQSIRLENADLREKVGQLERTIARQDEVIREYMRKKNKNAS